MNLRLLTWLPICFAVAFLHGCTHPRMASAPLTEQQRVWAAELQRWHPDWRQPYLTPTRATQEASLPRPGPVPAPPVLSPRGPTFDLLPPEMELAPLPDVGTGTEEFVLVPAEAPDALLAHPQTYEVRKGDTLSHVSLKFYGTAKSWRRIWDANREIVPAPDKLKPGTVLTIPLAE